MYTVCASDEDGAIALTTGPSLSKIGVQVSAASSVLYNFVVPK